MKLVNLIPLKEIDFSSQKAFDKYNKVHKLRPSTKVNIAGKTTTAGQASQVKGTSVFGKKYDSNKIGDFLNKVSGGSGMAQTNDNGSIEYNMGDGDMPTYTLYIGDDEAEKGKIAVEILPTYDNDPSNLNIHKTFDNQSDAMKFAGQLAKKYKKELEMDDNDKKSSDSKLEPIIKNIADLTDRNDHNGAVMALAKMTGDKTYIEQMQKIQRYHELKGHMPQSLIKYRTAIMNNLLMQAKNQYGDKVAKQLHNAF